MDFTYQFFQLLFQIATSVFYGTVEVSGLENIPDRDAPTLLLFNHHNSLGDCVLLISSLTMRDVSFCAKNTLWNEPIIGTIMSLVGATPIFRSNEHGANARIFNARIFASMYSSLLGNRYIRDQRVSRIQRMKSSSNGNIKLCGENRSYAPESIRTENCIALAPEGGSNFLPFSPKFKTGVAYITIETLLRFRKCANDNRQVSNVSKTENDKVKDNDMEKDYKIFLLPTVMNWTHRDKFRSDAMLQFLPPIAVSLASLDKMSAELNVDFSKMLIDEESEDKKKLARYLMEKIEKIFHEKMITAESWGLVDAAITATRLHLSLLGIERSAEISLTQYFMMIKLWTIALTNGLKEDISDDNVDTPAWEIMQYFDPVRQSRKAKPKESLDNSTYNVAARLLFYQNMLDKAGIEDYHLTLNEHCMSRNATLNWIGFVGDVLMAIFFAILSLPGYLLWSPIAFMHQRAERDIMKNGPHWAVSIAESKMLWSLMALAGFIIVSFIIGLLIGRLRMAIELPIIVLVLLQFTVRTFEEAIAFARHARETKNYLLMSKWRLDSLLSERKNMLEAISVVLQAAGNDQLRGLGKSCPLETNEIYTMPVLQRCLLLLKRREKDDWNEILRLRDHATMDYVS